MSKYSPKPWFGMVKSKFEWNKKKCIVTTKELVLEYRVKEATMWSSVVWFY